MTQDNVFYVRLTTSERPISVFNRTISPKGTKLDFQIQYFNNSNYIAPIIDSSNAPACRLVATGPSSLNGGSQTRGQMAQALAQSAGCSTSFVNNIGNWIDGNFTTSSQPNVQIALTGQLIVKSTKSAASTFADLSSIKCVCVCVCVLLIIIST